MTFVLGRGCLAVDEEIVEFASEACDECPKGRVEGDFGAAFSLSVKKESVGNICREHFLEAEGLGTELDFVGAVCLGFPAFVFDRNNRPILVKFDHIALAGKAERERADGQTPGDADARACFRGTVVSAFMEDTSLGGESILGPDLFEVDQGALARAIEPMLECGEGDEVFFGEHGRKFREGRDRGLVPLP